MGNKYSMFHNTQAVAKLENDQRKGPKKNLGPQGTTGCLSAYFISFETCILHEYPTKLITHNKWTLANQSQRETKREYRIISNSSEKKVPNSCITHMNTQLLYQKKNEKLQPSTLSSTGR